MTDTGPDMADSIPLIRQIVRHQIGTVSVMLPEGCPPSFRNRVRHGPAHADNLPRTHPTPEDQHHRKALSRAGGTKAGAALDRQLDSALQVARHAEPARSDPTTPSPTGHSALAAALRDIRRRLAVARSTAYTAATALRYECSDIDDDVAVTLQRCVGDEVDRQIERIDMLIGGVVPVVTHAKGDCQ